LVRLSNAYPGEGARDGRKEGNHKKMRILAYITIWMKLEAIMLNKIVSKRQILYGSTYVRI
jgi:hypothetical protein